MNVWKKTVAMVMCLGFTFSMFGCNPNKDSSSESSAPGESVVTPEDSSSDIIIPADAESFFDVIQTAKSASIRVDIDLDLTSAWLQDDKVVNSVESADIVLNIVVSENAKGGMDAKIVFMSSSSGVSSDGAAYDGDAVEETFYVIDGWAYRYDVADDCYYQSDVTVEQAIEEMLADEEIAPVVAILEEVLAALEGVDVSVEDVIAALEGEFDASAKIEDGALVTTIDFADPLNALVDYLGALNEETIVGDVVNDVLELIDPTLNYADILDEVAPLGAMTVSEAFTELDTAFEAEMGLGLQDYKDLMIMNASVISMLKDAGLTTEDIQKISAFSFEDDLLTPYGDYSLNAFLIEMLAMEDVPEDFDLIGEVCVMAKDYLSTTTLGQLEVDLDAAGMLDTIATISTLNFTAVETKFGVKYDNDYKVEKGILSVGVGFELPYIELNSKGEEVECVNECALNVNASVSQISEERVTIALDPSKAVVKSEA